MSLFSRGLLLAERVCVPAICGSDERTAYYNKHKIAYVARPPHGKDGFVRGGRFKKASNMNFCLTVSQQVSKVMQVRLSMAPAIGALCLVRACMGQACNAAGMRFSQQGERCCSGAH